MRFVTIAMRAIFALVGLVLIVLAFGLLGTATWSVIFRDDTDIGTAIINAIGYAVIALAVFDVAKYLIEEEVVNRSEMRFTGEARRGLTKFVSTIAIAVFLEALVLISAAGKKSIDLILYPTFLMAVGILIVVGLGVYQRQSAAAEKDIGGVRQEMREEEKARDARLEKIEEQPGKRATEA
ncbi:MAG: GNAT family acetyltransferase [Beijerinckiaceae bacterium]